MAHIKSLKAKVQSSTSNVEIKNNENPQWIYWKNNVFIISNNTTYKRMHISIHSNVHIIKRKAIKIFTNYLKSWAIQTDMLEIFQLQLLKYCSVSLNWQCMCNIWLTYDNMITTYGRGEK